MDFLVPSALKGWNNMQIHADLQADGYITFQSLLSPVDCGIPQDRRLARFCALRRDCAPKNWLEVYDDAVQALKLPTVTTLSLSLSAARRPCVRESFHVGQEEEAAQISSASWDEPQRFELQGQAAEEVGQIMACRPLEASPQI